MLKKLSIWLVKNLIIILVATLIFSYVSFDFPNLLKGVFGDVYNYASPESQKEAVGRLAETCSSLEPNSNVVSMQQLCNNKSMMQEMKDNCNEYYRLRNEGGIETDQKTEENCKQIESGEIEKSCKQIKSSPMQMDFSRIGSLCKDFKSGKINDKEFFYSVIGGSFEGISNSQPGAPKNGLFEKYNNFIGYLNKNRIIYLVLLGILIFLLYLLLNDFMLFYATLADIAFGIGILIMLPYVLVLLYAKFVGLDTTSILGSMFGLGNLFDIKSIISVILLLFLRTYNNFILTVGIIFLIGGAAGKIYLKTLKRKMSKEENEGKKAVKQKRK